MTKLTIKQQLLSAGIMEHQIDTHESDLYVIKNEVSEKWLNDYEFKNNVETFTNEDDNCKWYVIPFGYAKEWTLKRKPVRNIQFTKLDEKPTLLNELKEYQIELLETLVYKIFKTDNGAYTSSSDYAAFWNNENPNNNKAKYITLDGLYLRAVTFDNNENLIAVYWDNEENEYYYNVTFDF